MITFQNVNKHYGDFHVLKQINLQIEKGEVVVIIYHPVPVKAHCSDASTDLSRSMRECLQ